MLKVSFVGRGSVTNQQEAHQAAVFADGVAPKRVQQPFAYAGGTDDDEG